MSFWQSVALFLALAFLCGSVPWGFLAARAKRIDLRQIGSGNIGTTNAWRALGWKWGLGVMLLDVLKGLAPVVAWQCYPAVTDSAYRTPAAMLIGLAAVLGHTFTPWLKFKGGKGVATGCGVVLALFQWWSLLPLGLFGLTLAVSRMVSLSSILAALSLTALSLAVPALRSNWPFAVLTALLVLWTHRGNISRILGGTERKVGQRKT